jgi:hypothetical protein
MNKNQITITFPNNSRIRQDLINLKNKSHINISSFCSQAIYEKICTLKRESHEKITIRVDRHTEKQIDHILRHSKHDGVDMVIKEVVDLMYKKLK